MTRVFLLLLLPLLGGCAFLPFQSPAIPHPSGRPSPTVSSEYREQVGVIHAHSTASDGQLPPEAIARIADREGLDFLILTDHNTLKPLADGKQGRTGRTLLLIGEEISTQAGHVLALRVKREVSPRQEAQWTIDQVSAQGGLGFIAHPFWPRAPWKSPDARGFTGLEIYNAADDAMDESRLQLALWTVLAGSDLSISRWLDRSDRPLAFWDRLLAEGRRVVGIGGADAHGLVRFGLRLAPYDTVFKLVRDHLLIQGDPSETTIYDAIEKGHLFVAHDIVADARGFLFEAVGRGSVIGIMGDRLKWAPALRLHVHLPSPGEIRLLKDGKRIAGTSGQEETFPAEGPGIYRVEATRKAKPWIYSNPIYVIE